MHEGVLDLPALLARMTCNPAKLLGLPYGEVAQGKAADLIIFSDTAEWTVDKRTFASKGRNTPFDGFKLKGKNLVTIVGGKVVYRDAGFKG